MKHSIDLDTIPRAYTLSAAQRFVKRGFDLLGALSGGLLLSPLIVVGWLSAAVSTRSHGFFFQERVGRYGDLFRVVKLRTMRSTDLPGSTVTTSSDSRITRVGGFLRRLKIDELPQLWNVVCGEMSFVGPRPDVPGFADQLKGKEAAILELRPGITGPASIFFRREEVLLSDVEDPERFNSEVIWPKKVELNLRYLQNYSFWGDIILILQTLFGGGPEWKDEKGVDG